MALTIAGVSISVLVVGLTELIKRTKYISEQYIPLVPFVFALFLIGIVQIASGFDIEMLIGGSVTVGLMTNGLYSGVKKIWVG